MFRCIILNPLIKSHNNWTFRGGCQNTTYKNSILVIFLGGQFQKFPLNLKFSGLLGGIVKTVTWKIYLGEVFLKPPKSHENWNLDAVVKKLPPNIKFSWPLGREQGCEKTALENTFGGGSFRTPLKKFMRIEHFDMVVEKLPPQVKFSWLVGGVVTKPTWKKHLRVIILEPPPKKKSWELNF